MNTENRQAVKMPAEHLVCMDIMKCFGLLGIFLYHLFFQFEDLVPGILS